MKSSLIFLNYSNRMLQQLGTDNFISSSPPSSYSIIVLPPEDSLRTQDFHNDLVNTHLHYSGSTDTLMYSTCVVQTLFDSSMDECIAIYVSSVCSVVMAKQNPCVGIAIFDYRPLCKKSALKCCVEHAHRNLLFPCFNLKPGKCLV